MSFRSCLQNQSDDTICFEVLEHVRPFIASDPLNFINGLSFAIYGNFVTESNYRLSEKTISIVTISFPQKTVNTYFTGSWINFHASKQLHGIDLGLCLRIVNFHFFRMIILSVWQIRNKNRRS